MRAGIATLVIAAAVAATAQAQVVRRVSKVPLPDRDFTQVAVSDDGSTFLAISTVETEANPDRHPRLVRWDAAAAEWLALSDLNADSPAVSDDGQTIAFVGDAGVPPQRTAAYGIYVIDSSGGEPAPVVSPVAPLVVQPGSIVVSGDGSAIAFVTYDECDCPQGTGNDLRRIAPDGSQSTVLVEGWDDIGSIAISDDGARIAFVGKPGDADPYGAHGIEPDGTGLRPFPGFAAGSAHVEISGDGSRVAWDGLLSIGWDGQPLVTIDGADVVDLSESGAFLFYREVDAILAAPVSDPTSATTLVAGPLDDVARPAYAEADGALLFRTAPEGFPGIPDEDGSGEWALTDVGGTDPQPVTSIESRDPDDPLWYGELTMTPDGETIVAKGMFEDGEAIVVVPTDGSGETKLSEGADPVMTDDGEWIFYDAPASLGGPDCPFGRAIFRMRRDGSDRSRVYPAGPCAAPPDASTARLARDAERVYFKEIGTIYSTTLDGGDLRVELSEPISDRPTISVSGDGGVIAWGYRDAYVGEIVDLDGPTLTAGATPDVSRDGAWAVYNARNEFQVESIFLAEVATGAVQEIPPPVLGRIRVPQISGDGEWIQFYSGNPLVRVHRVSGATERTSGTIGKPDYYHPVGRESAISHDGSRIAYNNPWPGTIRGIYFADMHELQTWTIPRAESFELGWSDDPRASGYDVIRGDLASLAAAGDGTVDLGDVTCLIDDAYRPAASEDPADAVPALGSGYFYLFRPALIEGDEGYGASSGGDQRIPAAGDCSAEVEAGGQGLDDRQAVERGDHPRAGPGHEPLALEPLE